MCGITGFLDSAHQGDATWIRQTALAMANSLVHRGPDDGDTWSDVDAGLGLGFRRLAVIDLSPTGRQPMLSRCGNFVIVYNGEVYNSAELRQQLPGLRFRGHSDTEVVLEACAAWGVEAAVKQLNGMFAFALWDRRQRSLSLVRDRLGIKPLYWGAFAGLFLFGSELKALRHHPGWQQTVDRTALAAFMQQRYIPAPRSIYQGIHKLEPGHILTLQAGQPPRDTVYWSISATREAGLAKPLELDDATAIDRLDGLLDDAIGRRMIADVPLGAFLSAGIDSATVVAHMQKQASQAVKTFTIGFDEADYDEARQARIIAGALGCEHTELYVGEADALALIPQLPLIYDEPFADSSQIPTLLVSRMTRQHVTVALSGDGGDELFAGYNRYRSADLLRRWSALLKSPLRGIVSTALRSVERQHWNRLLGWLGSGRNRNFPGDRLHRLAAILDGEPGQIYREMISEWNDPQALVVGSGDPGGILWAAARGTGGKDYIADLQYLDTMNYLPDDILTKVDRASMAVSLEARTPLLDHRLVEFAWRLPMRFKIRGKHGKWLLRQALLRHLPAELMDRPKTGFKVPLGKWLGGALRDWAESLLDEQRLREEGFLDASLVRARWQAHLQGHSDCKGELWNVLMFQAWLETQ